MGWECALAWYGQAPALLDGCVVGRWLEAMEEGVGRWYSWGTWQPRVCGRGLLPPAPELAQGPTSLSIREAVRRHG